ncbi:MAG: FkbM family methyltransferase [Pseudomonadota bacterium]|nr:FkbM family methyltransferase [Pseudomonadota bacterium]
MRDKLIKDSLLRLVHGLGVDVVSRTNYSEISALIHALHPRESGIDLIRLGPDGDGGYLIPDDLSGIEYGFSPGVSTESGFEVDLAKRGLKVYLADYSVDSAASNNPNLFFDKKFIGSLSNGEFMTLDEWKNKKIPDYNGDLILQMDIEGAEFEAMMSVSSSLLSQFRIMVIEFHFLQELFNRPYFDLSSRVFRKILQSHTVVHIHPNNCCGSVKVPNQWTHGSRTECLEIPRVSEFTFYRNDKIRKESYCRVFPHSLDQDNTSKPSLVLPHCWYR